MHHIIINPTAGHGYSLALLPVLKDLFKKNRKDYRVLTTAAPMDARKMAFDACGGGGSEGIIAIGGDGTIQEIVTGMLEAANGAAIMPAPLGIMPCGSGNDFALTLSNGKRKKNNDRQTVENFFQHIMLNRTRPVDLIRAGDMAYLNIANMGLDARIVYNAVSLKKTFRHNAYLASAFKSILQHKNVPLQITVNGETHTGAFTLLAVCNGQYYGGGMRIAPHAQIDDGLITVCLIDGMTRPKAMALFPSVLVERHVRLKEIHFFQCDHLTVSLPGTETFCMDGNLYDRAGVLTFQIMPGALRLFTNSL